MPMSARQQYAFSLLFNPEAGQLIALYCSVSESENESHSEDVR